ncbi:ABC-2 type transport system ATP-binding protein [Actinokineospora baliensis]|uniref:ABC transporter ATP-binding protein n=1 Tax=Actinokineospora baliensis TaxID=547056 RepID=UPI001958D625|nr:ABC transporter ATP-binding protein [Actinokineospora baliensis]MBM7775221.1 ABC-2 type transport system ATP-binding protein [Actinokineospora baliensis]
MRESVIEVRGLRCRYGTFEAVRGVDFDVAQGELFALLGTNGAGKTTALEVLEGHRAPSGGTVRVFGLRPDADRARIRPRTGVLLQDSGPGGELTVLETLRMWRSLTSRPAEVDAALAASGLEHRAGVRTSKLSGGERRRLDLAVATLGEPELLFLDEPTTGLDPESRRRTWDMLRGMVARGTTVLLTTHYLEEAEHLAHRLAILHEGQVAVTGTLVDVLEREASRIAFVTPPGVVAADLPALTGTLDPDAFAAGRVEIRTRALQDDLTALLTWAAARDLQLARLRASHASLAEVFHNTQGVTA